MIQFRKFKKKYVSIRWAVLMSLLLCLVSCSKKSDTDLQVTGADTKDTYEEVAPPLTEPVFRWDFSKSGVVHTYTYEQDVRTQNSTGPASTGSSGTMTQEMTARGLLLIRSHGNNTAELRLKNMKAVMKINTEREKVNPVEQRIPDFTLQGLKEDGSTGIAGNSSQDMLIKSLFPLPSKPLKVGESIKTPEQMPFNLPGNELKVTGYSRITLSKYVKIGNRTCARLDMDTDISDITLPPEIKGKYNISTKGNAVFYFDVKDRIFVSGTTHIVMQYDLETPEADVPEKDKLSESEEKRISMTSDNFIRVALQE